MPSEAPPVCAFFGHHKCATQWIIYVIEGVCTDLGLRFGKAHPAGVVNDYGGLYNYTRTKQLDFVSFTDGSYSQICAAGKGFKGFHVIRDPRDMCVSGYYSHLYTHSIGRWKKLAEHRENLKNVSKEEGLFLVMDFMTFFYEQMYAWNYEDATIYDLKLEELSENPFKHYCEILRFLGLMEASQGKRPGLGYLFKAYFNQVNTKLRSPIPFLASNAALPQKRLKYILDVRSFKKVTKGRKRGEENVKSHFRKGKSGDWKNHFTGAHKSEFKKRFGKLLIKLGYEKDNNW